METVFKMDRMQLKSTSDEDRLKILNLVLTHASQNTFYTGCDPKVMRKQATSKRRTGLDKPGCDCPEAAQEARNNICSSGKRGWLLTLSPKNGAGCGGPKPNGYRADAVSH